MHISHINQNLRKKFGLSMNEYVVIDWYYRKCELETSGWADWTYEECANEVNLAKSTVHAAVQKAITKKLMTVDAYTGKKKVDLKWLD